jgi:RNA polymerase sigma-70 factor (sigma-E family)
MLDPSKPGSHPGNQDHGLEPAPVIGALTAVPGPGEQWSRAGAHANQEASTARTSGAWMDRDADRAVTALYHMHYRSLVSLAVLLVRDIATAEELVQDSFVAMHSAWRRLADGDRALSYLHRSVVSRSRAVLRHRMVAGKSLPKLAPDTPGADSVPIIGLEHSPLISALQTVVPRQREALVLRYYADLPEAQIASAMGISKGAVRKHTAGAMFSLRAELRRTNS